MDKLKKDIGSWLPDDEELIERDNIFKNIFKRHYLDDCEENGIDIDDWVKICEDEEEVEYDSDEEEAEEDLTEDIDPKSVVPFSRQNVLPPEYDNDDFRQTLREVIRDRMKNLKRNRTLDQLEFFGSCHKTSETESIYETNVSTPGYSAKSRFWQKARDEEVFDSSPKISVHPHFRSSQPFSGPNGFHGFPAYPPAPPQYVDRPHYFTTHMNPYPHPPQYRLKMREYEMEYVNNPPFYYPQFHHSQPMFVPPLPQSRNRAILPSPNSEDSSSRSKFRLSPPKPRRVLGSSQKSNIMKSPELKTTKCSVVMDKLLIGFSSTKYKNLDLMIPSSFKGLFDKDRKVQDRIAVEKSKDKENVQSATKSNLKSSKSSSEPLTGNQRLEKQNSDNRMDQDRNIPSTDSPILGSSLTSILLNSPYEISSSSDEELMLGKKKNRGRPKKRKHTTNSRNNYSDDNDPDYKYRDMTSNNNKMDRKRIRYQENSKTKKNAQKPEDSRKLESMKTKDPKLPSKSSKPAPGTSKTVDKVKKNHPTYSRVLICDSDTSTNSEDNDKDTAQSLKTTKSQKSRSVNSKIGSADSSKTVEVKSKPSEKEPDVISIYDSDSSSSSVMNLKRLKDKISTSKPSQSSNCEKVGFSKSKNDKKSSKQADVPSKVVGNLCDKPEINKKHPEKPQTQNSQKVDLSTISSGSKSTKNDSKSSKTAEKGEGLSAVKNVEGASDSTIFKVPERPSTFEGFDNNKPKLSGNKDRTKIDDSVKSKHQKTQDKAKESSKSQKSVVETSKSAKKSENDSKSKSGDKSKSSGSSKAFSIYYSNFEELQQVKSSEIKDKSALKLSKFSEKQTKNSSVEGTSKSAKSCESDLNKLDYLMTPDDRETPSKNSTSGNENKSGNLKSAGKTLKSSDSEIRPSKHSSSKYGDTKKHNLSDNVKSLKSVEGSSKTAENFENKNSKLNDIKKHITTEVKDKSAGQSSKSGNKVKSNLPSQTKPNKYKLYPIMESESSLSEDNSSKPEPQKPTTKNFEKPVKNRSVTGGVGASSSFSQTNRTFETSSISNSSRNISFKISASMMELRNILDGDSTTDEEADNTTLAVAPTTSYANVVKNGSSQSKSQNSNKSNQAMRFGESSKASTNEPIKKKVLSHRSSKTSNKKIWYDDSDSDDDYKP